ncbi:hypothetical protein RHMOL_Rhmol10G0142700 [Rhododendron molle]|uniref:Uncharacterized protein n=1 Tax=Rhododendron molle TaxID=49168 RepID=A0ACC0M1U2_RHOML|nr:hypothetical protein RHMOL_Rhmol10G0142700 [Rhododendron molle]
MCVCVCAHLFEPVRTMKATTTAMTMTIRTTKRTTMKKAKDRSVLSGSYFLCFLFTQIFFVMQDFESERQWKLAPWSQQGHVGPGHKGRKESEAIEFLRCAREVKYDAVIVDSSDHVGQQFGFVRFGNRNEAIKAAEEINGSWVWGHRLVVNLARFQSQKQRQLNWQLQRNAVLNRGAFEKSSHMHGSEKGNGRRNVVWEEGNRRNQKLKHRQDMSMGNRIDWDKGSWRNQEMKQRHGVAMGNRGIGVRTMGGDMVVLTFLDIAERDSMFNGGKMAWLREWFVESHKWEDAKNNPVSRLIWLNCYGIPLHLWNAQTFLNIGKLWGEVVLIAEDTLKDLSFSVGKVLISTREMDLINQIVEINNNGSVSQIRVMEEQMVVNTILRTDCACPGCRIEVSSPKPSTEESKENQNRENDDDVDDDADWVEEVAETEGNNVDNLPYVNATYAAHPLPDVNATDVAHDAGKVNFESMQLALFKDNNKVLEAIRCSRSLQQPCIPKGMGTVSSAVENLHHQNKAEKVSLSNKLLVNIDPSKETKKTKRKVKSVEDILGIPKATGTRKGGRRRKQKCVVFHSALAAAALLVSTEGINNRNRILLNESQAVWTVTKIMGADYFGNDEEVISSIMVTDEEELLKAALAVHQTAA